MKIEQRGDRVYLSGVINEDSDFSPLLSKPSPLKIDFSGVERINSVGVRSWMRFLSQWDDKKQIEYWECSVAIVDQLSIIGSLRGVRVKVASIQSLCLPTECNGCAAEGEIRITPEDYRNDSSLQSFLKPCPTCGEKVIVATPEISGLFS